MKRLFVALFLVGVVSSIVNAGLHHYQHDNPSSNKKTTPNMCV
ncbi:hypothetical protein [Pseudobdellovibrio sp. HCB154]